MGLTVGRRLARHVEIALPVPGAEFLTQLVPLWRYAVWLVALFSIAAAAVAIRLDVQQLRENLDRNDRLQRQSEVLRERLRLEVDARRRVASLERIGTTMSLEPVTVRSVEVSP